MDRENFYLLLELEIDPPEEDPQKIQDAIKRMQTTWSRLRNHPTKGLQAKNNIGLIPEIRKVMEDPELRMAEAEDARILLGKRQGEIFAEIDRHLKLHKSKGYVTNQEIKSLSELHSIDEEEIRARIKIMEEEDQVELERQLGMRVGKGYITPDELTKLSKAHGISEKDLKKRINVPIRKGGDATAKAKGLDKSIEKVIEDNLKIVGHSSLYDFLGIQETASLELLVNRAREKEDQILKIARKDAVVTASAILAGQCASIFQSPESRAAYDVTRGRSKLRELEADIDVAGIDGKIRKQYFEILVGTAQELGMDSKEAAAYVKKYCRKKKYAIEGMERKKLSKKQLIAAGVGLLLLIICGVGGFFAFKSMQVKGRYQDMIAKAGSLKSLEDRVKVFQDYLASSPPEKYSSLASEEMRKTRQLIATRKEKAAYDQSSSRAKAYLDSKDFKRAIAVLNLHLKQFPKGSTAGSAKKALNDIRTQWDEFEYKAISALAGAESEDRINAYIKYLGNHPEGKHSEEVKKFIWEMGEEFYLFTHRKIKDAEAAEDWAAAVEHCDSYISIYNNARAKQLKKQKIVFQTRLRDMTVLQRLDEKASAKGTDYDGAMRVYREHLLAYPNTTAKEKITARIAALQNRKLTSAIESAASEMRAAIGASKGRFEERIPGTVFDSVTGLTWTLLDSGTVFGRCMDYTQANKYVSALNTGGLKDWRLPEVNELEEIYKTEQPFPSGQVKVYWTSESFAAYSGDGQAYQKVKVVDSEKGEKGQARIMSSRKCAFVRAVRP